MEYFSFLIILKILKLLLKLFLISSEVLSSSLSSTKQTKNSKETNICSIFQVILFCHHHYKLVLKLQNQTIYIFVPSPISIILTIISSF